MGLKTVVNQEILEVMDNEGLSLGMLLATSEDIKLAKVELDLTLQSINPLEEDIRIIRGVRKSYKDLEIHSKYVKEKLKTYLN